MRGSARVLPRSIRVAVLGASAGAVEALSVLLAGLPAGLRIPLVIVVHLPPSGPSLLPELFAGKCPLQVMEAEDKQPLTQGVVYFAPPDYHLLVESPSLLSLNADPPVNFSRPSIDALFESAAAAVGPDLLGILLTGANADGARGLQAIHRAGGFTVVQEPATAVARAMPQAALDLFEPDRVLDLPEIAALLGQLVTRAPK